MNEKKEIKKEGNNMAKNLKKMPDTLAVSTCAKELYREFILATTGIAKKYKWGICTGMERSLDNILRLINQCNDLPLTKDICGIKPTRELVEERLHRCLDIYAEIHNFQGFLDIAATLPECFSQKVITKFGMLLGELQDKVEAWTRWTADRSKEIIASLSV